MKKYLVILMILLVATSCAALEDSAEGSDSVKETQLQEMREKIQALEEINSEQELRISELVEAEEELIEKLKNSQAERASMMNAFTSTEHQVQLAYNIALSYRNDIKDIVNLYSELDLDDDYKFHGLDTLSDDQKDAIIRGAEEYLGNCMDWNVVEYEEEVFVGEKPEPLNLYEILAVTEDDPMFHAGDDEEKTLHFKVYYYKSEIMTNTADSEPVLDFRGPFAGVSAFHVVIEEVDGVWVTTYVGLG